jgi:hypothetical protein
MTLNYRASVCRHCGTQVLEPAEGLTDGRVIDWEGQAHTCSTAASLTYQERCAVCAAWSPRDFVLRETAAGAELRLCSFDCLGRYADQQLRDGYR